MPNTLCLHTGTRDRPHGGGRVEATPGVLAKNSGLFGPDLPVAEGGDAIMQLSHSANSNCWEETYRTPFLENTAQRFIGTTP